jgi:hypothetical protein
MAISTFPCNADIYNLIAKCLIRDISPKLPSFQFLLLFQGLPSILPKLPHRVALHRVVPCLAKEFVNPHMVPFVLPAVLMVAEEASKNDYVLYILPELKHVMKITDPVQVIFTHNSLDFGQA